VSRNQQQLNQQACERAIAELRSLPRDKRAEYLRKIGILTESGELAPPYADTPLPTGEGPSGDESFRSKPHASVTQKPDLARDAGGLLPNVAGIAPVVAEPRHSVVDRARLASAAAPTWSTCRLQADRVVAVSGGSVPESSACTPCPPARLRVVAHAAAPRTKEAYCPGPQSRSNPRRGLSLARGPVALRPRTCSF